MEALYTLKVMLGIAPDIKDEATDAKLGFALDNATEIIKNYCNIDEIPEGLGNTVVRMAVDLYRNERPGESDVPQGIKSVTTGDTSTSFAVTETNGYAESLLRNYKAQLNRYRRVAFR
jgi:hypothetical protein